MCLALFSASLAAANLCEVSGFDSEIEAHPNLTEVKIDQPLLEGGAAGVFEGDALRAIRWRSDGDSSEWLSDPFDVLIFSEMPTGKATDSYVRSAIATCLEEMSDLSTTSSPERIGKAVWKLRLPADDREKTFGPVLNWQIPESTEVAEPESKWQRFQSCLEDEDLKASESRAWPIEPRSDKISNLDSLEAADLEAEPKVGCAGSYLDQYLARVGLPHPSPTCGIGPKAVVAVLDSGVKGNSQFDKRLRYDRGADFTVKPYCQCATPPAGPCACGANVSDGHGTRMAGLIGGKDLGVDPEALLIPVRIYQQGCIATEAIIRGLWHAQKVGAEIVSASWECKSFDMGPVRAEIRAHASDLLVVMAAGNDGAVDLTGTCERPQTWCEQNLLVVAGLDEKGAYYGTRGTAAQVVGPSWDIEGLGGAACAAGTSDGTALVAGAAALYGRCLGGAVPPLARSPGGRKAAIIKSTCAKAFLQNDCKGCGFLEVASLLQGQDGDPVCPSFPELLVTADQEQPTQSCPTQCQGQN